MTKRADQLRRRGGIALVAHGGGWSVDASVRVADWDRQALERILTHIGEPAEAPEVMPARGPPQAELEFDQVDQTAGDGGDIGIFGSVSRDSAGFTVWPAP